MGPKTHRYEVAVVWTRNRGEGTAGYRAYARDHNVMAEGRPSIAGSWDPTFRGDPARWNPEKMLVASLSQCHLWYLHLCAVSDVVVVAYAALALHDRAHDLCFVASSVNFPVRHEPEIDVR